MHARLIPALLLAAIAPPALAQCGPEWMAEVPTAQWDIYATLVLPGGDLIVGGTIAWLDGVPAHGVARRDAATGRWSALGDGVDGTVYCLALMPNGDIIAGGLFDHAGGVPASSIARWDGAGWSALGGGVGTVSSGRGLVRALAALPSGELLVGGIFEVAGGVPVTSIARWDGTAWHSIGAALGGSDLLFTSVDAILLPPTGGAIVAGSFDSVNAVEAHSIVRWDGATWTAMGRGLGTEVQSLAQLDDGSIVAAGAFFVPSANGNLARVARWNGGDWEPIGPGVNGNVASLAAGPHGELIIGGVFSPGSFTTANRVARWNGSAWVGLGTGVDGLTHVVRSIALLPDGDIVVGGNFETAGGVRSPGLARYTSGHCCPADLDDGSGTGTHDGAITIDDLLYFLVAFEAGDTAADLDDGSGTGNHDGAVTIDDLLFFLAHFEAGC